MAAFQFPDPTVTQTVTNEETGTKYVWKENPGKWVVENSSNGSSSQPSNSTLPYQLTVGERDSVTGEEVSVFQIFETIALKDFLGNSLGDVAFESSGGLAIAISNDYPYPVIKFQANSIQDTTRYNKGRIYAEELRNGLVPLTYNIVNRTGVPTARAGELSTDAMKASEIKFISFGDTSAEGLPIGTVSVGDRLCLTKADQGRKYFYNITGGSTDGGIYGVDFIEEDSWYGTSNITQNPHYLEIFTRTIPSGITIDLEDYYDKSEIDAKFENVDATTSRELALSLISGLKIAVTLATDFQDLREKMLLKLSEIEIAATLES